MMKIKAGHGRALLCITNPHDQQFLCSSIIEHSLSVREVEKALDYWKEHGTFPAELMHNYIAPKKKEKKENTELCQVIKDIDLKLKRYFP